MEHRRTLISYKGEIVNKDIMRACGFGKEVDAVEQGNCPICGKKIDMNDFTDPISVKEFHISGMCQDCQDKIFKAHFKEPQYYSDEDLQNLLNTIDSGRYS
jgi:hypothetical protein